MDALLWTIIGFLSGSIPYSLWIGRLAAKRDIRQFGDHNPGAANVLHAAGWGWAILALLLDGFKGAIPIWIAWFYLKIDGWEILPIALAPVAGHAFSPLLRWRGGKAVAVTFGTWAGLTLGAGPTVLGLLMGLFNAVVRTSGWAVMFSMVGFGAYIYRVYAPVHPEFMAVWLGNLLILAWKHREDLRRAPGLKNPLARIKP